GFAAATVGVAAAWILTPLVAGVILVAAVRADQRPSTAIDVAGLPSHLQRTVGSTFDQLPEGDAQRLLLDVVTQARPLFAGGQTAFDPKQDAVSRDNASNLVDACCATALELARLDAAFASRAGASSDWA